MKKNQYNSIGVSKEFTITTSVWMISLIFENGRGQLKEKGNNCKISQIGTSPGLPVSFSLLLSLFWDGGLALKKH